MSLSIFLLLRCVALTFFFMTKADKVDDIVKIINEGTHKAKNYQFPLNNEALYPSTLPDEVIDFGSYDYIVVGAGTAGAIVAKRLSEANKKTLLIEAGGDENAFSLIPGVWKINLFSEQNWGYRTKPQKHICQGIINEQCLYPRGKSLGGSSAINGMLYARSNELDQSFWSDYGITGWTWEDVLPYYKKLEDYSNIYGDPGYHGYDGPVPIDYSRPASLLIREFFQAYSEMGQLITDDLYGKVYMATGKIQYSMKNGKRASTNQCYLQDINSYLSIITKAYVYKVIIEDMKALGVEFSKDNVRYRAKSKVEVIISAGTTNTPQILMLSGVGPHQELDKHNIPMVVDLPVGKHFQDHFTFNVEFQANFPFSEKSLEVDVWELLSGTGRLATSDNYAFAYISTDPQVTDYPDVEIIFYAERTPYHGNINIYQLKNEVLASIGTAMSQVSKNYTFSLISLLLHPKSEGEITLQSSNPRDFPLVDSMTYFDEDDIERIYKGVLRALEVVNTEVFKRLDASLIEIILPACKDHQFGSEAFWKCYIGQMTYAASHSVGSCRMGRPGESVIDSNFKVYGIEALRVIDLSAVPRPNSGHPYAMAMMVGEKGADLVLKDNKP